MNSEEAVRLIMLELGYVELLDPDSKSGWWNQERDDYMTAGQAERECRDLNVLAEIGKDHEWVMILRLADNSCDIYEKHETHYLSDSQGITIQEAAMLATAEALKKHD